MGIVRSQGGWYPRRRKLQEHLTKRLITPYQYVIYNLLLDLADFNTGIVMTNAKGLCSITGEQMSEDTIDRYMRELEHKGYIRRYARPGKRGYYTILVNKYICTAGEFTGYAVNLEGMSNSRYLSYLKVDWEEEVDSDMRPEHKPSILNALLRISDNYHVDEDLTLDAGFELEVRVDMRSDNIIIIKNT